MALNKTATGCIRARIQVAGEAVGAKVYPHRLRHTCATQLLNAGCRITSIQRFLGHKKLNTTMIYAKARDQTVADDYYAAMRLSALFVLRRRTATCLYETSHGAEAAFLSPRLALKGHAADLSFYQIRE